jgi:hypothetical protein
MFFCLILLVAWCFVPAAFAADDDDDDEEEEDPWGEAKLDHELNVAWDYPSEYIARPLNYSKRVTEFGIRFDQKYARHYFDDEGDLVEGSFKTKKQTFELFLGMGFSDNWSLAITFPFVYKKTKVFEGNQNYRLGRDNTYGALFEEATVDFVDNHELWKVWEADLPSMGDVRLWSGYSVYRKMDPRTTSVILEVEVKFPTGDDNPRRGGEVRNHLTTGQTDSYLGVGFKQQAWKFAFEAHGGYNIRWKSSTKYSAGKVDLGDQLLGDLEVMFQIPEVAPLWSNINVGGVVQYMGRMDFGVEIDGKKPMFTYIEDNLGHEVNLEDAPGSLISAGPKVVYESPITRWTGWFDEVLFSMDIPISGQRTFLVQSKSSYLPPWELETYEGVGVTYSLGVIKRWQ